MTINASTPDDGRARLEFIEIELRFVQNCLRDAGLELAHQNVTKAKELLDVAKRSRDTVLDHLPKLRREIDTRNLKAFARLLTEDIRELEAEIEVQAETERYLRQ